MIAANREKIKPGSKSDRGSIISITARGWVHPIAFSIHCPHPYFKTMTIKDERGMLAASDQLTTDSLTASANDFTFEVQTPSSSQASVEVPHAETPLAASLSPTTIEDTEEARRIQHWKESPFAVGLVDVTWKDSRRSRVGSEQECYMKASAWICPLLGAGRVGNMAVLKQSTVYHEVKRNDGSIERIERPNLQCVLGPYWVVPVLITYPIILVLTFMAARKVRSQHIALIVVWSVLTLILILSLSLVACRDPGILYRQRQIPQDDDGGDWRWNDQAQTFRPKSANFDPECQAVIDGFDHTCPWVGNGVGRGNIWAFRIFLGSVVACLILDIAIISNPFG